MSVIVKMRCIRRGEIANSWGPAGVVALEVFFQPVYGTKENNDVNSQWSKHTPSGEFRLQITNPQAYRQFHIGEEYFITITHSSEIDDKLKADIEKLQIPTNLERL